MVSFWRSALSPRRFLNDESGATALEYSLIIALIFLVMIVGIGLYGDSAQHLYTNLSTKVVAVLSGS